MCDNTDEYSAVINNLNYFFNKVLFAAQYEGNWSVKSIEQALGWALYCEKAIEEANIKHAVSSYLLLKTSNQNYSIDDSGSLQRLLISNLFINQLLTKDIFVSLYDMSIRELGTDVTKQIVDYSISKVNNYNTAISALQSNDMKKTYNTFKIRLLIEAASNSSIPVSALNHLLVNEDSMEMLLELTEKLEEKEKVKMMICLGEWLSSELGKDNYLIFNHISYLSLSRLENVCETFPGLQTKLLLFLSSLGTSLCDDKDYKNSDKYKSILALSCTFLKSSKLNHQTKNAFSAWVLSKEAYFWHELYSASVCFN